MATFDPRTGIQTFDPTVDPANTPSVDLNAAAGGVAPSTATSLAPSPRSPELESWLAEVDQKMTQYGYADPYNMTGWGPVNQGYEDFRYGTYGENLITSPLDQFAGAAGMQDVDWSPYLDQYWMNEWQDQIANRRTPEHIFSHRQGYGDTLLGVLDLASADFGNPALAEIGRTNIGPGTDFYRDYNTLGNWLESRRDEARNAKAMSVIGLLAGGLLAPGISEWAGGGAGGAVAAGAGTGAIRGLAMGDPVGGALRGAATAGISEYATPLVAEGFQNVFDSFNPDAVYAGMEGVDGGMLRQGGTATSFIPTDPVPQLPLFGGGGFEGPTPLFSTPAQMGTDFSTPAMTAIEGAGGMLSQVPAAAALEQFFPQTAAALPTPAPAQPTLAEQLAERLTGALTKGIGAQDSVPQGAPQRGEGQEDSAYAQDLAQYVSQYVPTVSAQAMAERGLTPGTPAYYEYIMGEFDGLIQNLAGNVDLDAADLSQALRGKTAEEMETLRRVLYVRGQMGQLMGSGMYADPLSDMGEEVIAPGGAQVNPGMAAYQRGLARSASGIGMLAPGEQEQELRGMLGRSPDFYGMQGRADERATQEGQYLAYIEELKRRGMLGSGGNFGATGDPELDALLGSA